MTNLVKLPSIHLDPREKPARVRFSRIRDELNYLFVDVECKPGHWINNDFVSRLITAMAWAWLTRENVASSVVVLTHYNFSRREMLEIFESAYNRADVLVTHYGRRFDLPLINGNREREGLSPLKPKLVLDTMLDRLKTLGRSSSQKNLSADYGLPEKKVDVTLREWEGFNDKETGYEQKIIERVRDDVRQNIALFQALRERGMLGKPKMMDYTERSRRG